jgi:hypothetical protein
MVLLRLDILPVPTVPQYMSPGDGFVMCPKSIKHSSICRSNRRYVSRIVSAGEIGEM